MTQKIIIDAENAVLGRLSSFAAKQALQGKEILIVNSEKTIIIGKEGNILENFLEKMKKGGSGLKGPFISKLPEKILKRTIRGMLPYTQGRGRDAFKKIKCYSGIPKEFEKEKMIKAGRGKEGVSLERVSELLRQRGVKK